MSEMDNASSQPQRRPVITAVDKDDLVIPVSILHLKERRYPLLLGLLCQVSILTRIRIPIRSLNLVPS